MTDIRSNIIGLLKSYPHKKRQIAQLRFELEHPAHIGEKELIDSLALGSGPAGDGIRTIGHISNKTMAIALRYQDVMQRMNSEAITDILQELRILEAEANRLEHYISMLDEQKAQVISLLYFEKKPWSEIEKEMNISKCSISNYRKNALDELERMYSYLDRINGKESEHDG